MSADSSKWVLTTYWRSKISYHEICLDEFSIGGEICEALWENLSVFRSKVEWVPRRLAGWNCRMDLQDGAPSPILLEGG